MIENGVLSYVICSHLRFGSSIMVFMSAFTASGDVLCVTLMSVVLFAHHLHVISHRGDPSIFKCHVIVITRSWPHAKAQTKCCFLSSSLMQFAR